MDAKPKPKLIQGALARDERGSVAHVNAFDFAGVCRFYVIDNAQPYVPRAWHGHRVEAKYVFVAVGQAVIGVADLDTGETFRFVLDALGPEVLYIPAGYANGSMSCSHNTKIVHFSTVPLSEAADDDLRFPLEHFKMDWGGAPGGPVKEKIEVLW